MRVGGLGPVELIVILLIVLVIFGVGRLGKIGGELGSAIRQFRAGLSGNDEKKDTDKKDNPQA